jgi:hypothetical protein
MTPCVFAPLTEFSAQVFAALRSLALVATAGHVFVPPPMLAKEESNVPAMTIDPPRQISGPRASRPRAIG